MKKLTIVSLVATLFVGSVFTTQATETVYAADSVLSENEEGNNDMLATTDNLVIPGAGTYEYVGTVSDTKDYVKITFTNAGVLKFSAENTSNPSENFDMGFEVLDSTGKKAFHLSDYDK